MKVPKFMVWHSLIHSEFPSTIVNPIVTAAKNEIATQYTISATRNGAIKYRKESLKKLATR